MKPKIENRLLLLDCAKGIGIILVVFRHLVVLDIWATTLMTGLFELISLFHMPIFFLISGFLMGPKLEKNDYLIKKMKQLIVPYLTFNLIVLTIKLGVQGSLQLVSPVDTDTILWHLFLAPKGGYASYLWFLYVLCIIIMIYPIMRRLVKSKPILIGLLAIVGVFQLPTIFCLNLVAKYILFFAIGDSLSKLVKQENRLQINYKNLLAGGVACFAPLGGRVCMPPRGTQYPAYGFQK